MSSKKPTIKRILKEASELASQPSPDYHAAPLESDLYEWHFTIRGPPSPSPFAGGFYHGRIVLPPAYPLKPPSFRFLTPSGRFEVNREICLSISGHHEETWQPAWGVRTALVAIRSFMDTSAGGQVGGMEASEGVRMRMAGQSAGWKCAACGKRNAEIMAEQDQMVAERVEGEGKAKEEVPEELRLAYREDMGKGSEEQAEDQAKGKVPEQAPPLADRIINTDEPTAVTNMTTRAAAPPAPAPQARPAQLIQPRAYQPQAPQIQRINAANNGVPAWIDKAIYGTIAAIVFLVFRDWILTLLS